MEDIGLEEEKPVVVRVKRKASQMPLDALWLEINDRPLKRTQLDFGNLSTFTSSAVKEDLKTKKLLVQHVETVSSSEGIENALQSFMIGVGTCLLSTVNRRRCSASLKARGTLTCNLAHFSLQLGAAAVYHL